MEISVFKAPIRTYHNGNGTGKGNSQVYESQPLKTTLHPPSRFSSPFLSLPKVSVIIPTLNEAKNLPYVLPYIPDWVYEVIIVDGHSTDNTLEVARTLYPEVTVVSAVQRGKGAALRAGFDAAKGDILVMLDADGSMNPLEIPLYVSALMTGMDFVKGSRFIQGGGTADMTSIRRLGNWGLTVLVRLLFGGGFSDLCYGYAGFWRRALDVLDLDATGFEIETLMNVRALRNRLKIAELPSFESNRVHGSSNLNAIWDGWRILQTIGRERFSAPKNHIRSHWTWELERRSILSSKRHRI